MRCDIDYNPIARDSTFRGVEDDGGRDHCDTKASPVALR